MKQRFDMNTYEPARSLTIIHLVHTRPDPSARVDVSALGEQVSDLLQVPALGCLEQPAELGDLRDPSRA